MKTAGYDTRDGFEDDLTIVMFSSEHVTNAMIPICSFGKALKFSAELIGHIRFSKQNSLDDIQARIL